MRHVFLAYKTDLSSLQCDTFTAYKQIWNYKNNAFLKFINTDLKPQIQHRFELHKHR